MNTFLNYLTVLTLAALLLAPALYGIVRDHRTNRQLRAARERLETVRGVRAERAARPVGVGRRRMA